MDRRQDDVAGGNLESHSRSLGSSLVRSPSVHPTRRRSTSAGRRAYPAP